TIVQIISANGTRFNDRPLRFVNDLNILDKQYIFFTDSDWKYQRRNFPLAILRADPRGRLIRYDMINGKFWIDGPKSGQTEYLPTEIIRYFMPSNRYGLAIEIDNRGKILRSLHDSDGVKVPSTSQVTEYNGYLYFGSYYLPNIAAFKL
ncbi:unnamed protein product, partial [Didymodactylos carnosus]